MATIITTNMLLPAPVVGQEPGPQFATDINNCLTIIDQHNHQPGYGVQISSAGLNINADLPINSNNLTIVRSLRFDPQSAVLTLSADLGCLYEVGNDLYYNDGVGNQVRMTQSGAVAGTPGSIANLASPASASYVSANQTFVFQSAANTPANLDGASINLRNLTANSKALSLVPPASMATDYTINLPSLPSQLNLLAMDTSGAITASVNVDNASLQLNANVLSIKAGGIQTAMIATYAVTTPTIAPQTITVAKMAPFTTGVTVAANGFATSLSTGAGSTQSGGYSQVFNLTVTITTTGRPVMLFLDSDASGLEANVTMGGASVTGGIRFYRDGVSTGKTFLCQGVVSSSSWPSSSFVTYDFPAPGTYTYTVQARGDSGSIEVAYTTLNAYEI